MRTIRWAAWAAVVVLSGCGADKVAGPPPPTPDPNTLVIPGPSTGPTEITFVSADPAPGSLVSGCGPDLDGCTGKVRMVFNLRPSQTGPVLRMTVFLHSTEKRACLFTSGEPFELQAGEVRTVAVAFERYDACTAPVTIATMAAIVEGTVEVASRREFALRYTLSP